MDHFQVHDETDLKQLYGWMTRGCIAADRALLKWMQIAEVGTMIHHRLGTLVRMKDH